MEPIVDNYYVDLLALCAFEIPYRDPKPFRVEKVLICLIFRYYFTQSVEQIKSLSKSGTTRI